MRTLLPVLCSFTFLGGAVTAEYLDINPFAEKPYWGVNARLVEQAEGRLNVIADFTKGDCQLVLFSVVGIGFNGVSVLEYDDLDNRVTAEGEQEDRLAGDTTLRISVDLGSEVFDSVELRTRHTCGVGSDAVKVDKVFLRVPL